MNSITYNIPAHLILGYSGRKTIVRSHYPAEIVQHLAGQNLENVQYVQLLTVDLDAEAQTLLSNWAIRVALDLVIRNPETEFPLLYNFSKLIDRHPIRVTIPVKPGFVKAVKLALALHFAVKLDVGQPDEALIEEMSEVLDLYLHRSGVSQPVEFFHSLFVSSYKQDPTSVWIVQEEDPEYFCFVTDDGSETFSKRFAGCDPTNASGGTTRINDLTDSATPHECDTCKFLPTCRGYFKWPDSSFSCNGVKSIFSAIDSAAEELRENVAAASAQGGDRA